MQNNLLNFLIYKIRLRKRASKEFSFLLQAGTDSQKESSAI